MVCVLLPVFLAERVRVRGAETKTVLTIMHEASDEAVRNGDVESVMMRTAIDRFREMHPEVEVREEILSQEAGYEIKAKTLAAANELPDLIQLLPSMMESFYQNGELLDLAPILKENQEWYDTFADGMFGDYTFGDTILGIPRCSIVNSFIYYNTEIFRECGYDHFPADTGEFKEAVQAIIDHGYIPMATGNKGKYAVASQIMPGILMKFCSQDWYQKLKAHKASFEDPECVEAIRYLKELIDMGFFNVDMNSLEPDQARQYYFDGKAAMYGAGSYSVSNFINGAPEEILSVTDMTLFPAAEGKEELAGQIVRGQGWGMSISSRVTEEQQEAAVSFLKLMSGPEMQKLLLEGGSLATAKEIPCDESGLDPFFAEFLDMCGRYDRIVGCPEVQLSNAYMEASYNGYQELTVGLVSPEELAVKLEAAHKSSR